jgi:hypothetical protein
MQSNGHFGALNKKQTTSTDYVFYKPAWAPGQMIKTVSSTTIGKRSIYKIIIQNHHTYFLLRSMLDLRSTSIVISTTMVNAFRITVMKYTETVQSKDVTGQKIITKGLDTVPLGLGFGNHRSYDPYDHAVTVMDTSKDYDCVIPAFYLEKQKAHGVTNLNLHFPHCSLQCYSHDKIHPKYIITFNRRVSFN